MALLSARMTSTLDKVAELIRSRLNEIDDESRQLERALKQLGGNSRGSAATGQPSSAKSGPKSTPRANRRR